MCEADTTGIQRPLVASRFPRAARGIAHVGVLKSLKNTASR